MKLFLLCATFLTYSCFVNADNIPDCSGAERWPSAMVQVNLKNEFGITLSDIEKIDVERIANQPLDEEVHRQVHEVTLTLNDNRVFKAITLHDASAEECSMSGVKIYWVQKESGAM
ncbi:hypothetical protein [Thaumasiovibrio subtropicus]|uniref:hypothetical protein n=1 Tax=Thaumasiovibrio subtropicus TaxID=1891207 RepID=UPI000B36043C|nr:hypothetical protein [Thaumasiovibrio subtropicus]